MVVVFLSPILLVALMQSFSFGHELDKDVVFVNAPFMNYKYIDSTTSVVKASCSSVDNKLLDKHLEVELNPQIEGAAQQTNCQYIYFPDFCICLSIDSLVTYSSLV